MINSVHTTKYFRLERGARQENPISAYLFILALEILFILIKFNKDIDGINIFNHKHLYTADADDTTFFLKNQTSVKNVLNDIETFLNFSGLRQMQENWNRGSERCKCGMKNINLTKESIKILAIYISYNKKI